MTIPLPQIFHVAAGLLVSLLAVNQAVAEEPKPEPQQTILQSRQSLAEDPFRPLYHFSSPKGKLWDPGGFCKWKGRYHLFYIGWGGKGHAVSDDLVYWEDLSPIPELGGFSLSIRPPRRCGDL